MGSASMSVNSAASFDFNDHRDGDVAPDPDGPDAHASAAAKYVQGPVGMVRTTKNFATKIFNGQRAGVMVIHLNDGGSLSFYKEARASLLRYRRSSSGSGI